MARMSSALRCLMNSEYRKPPAADAVMSARMDRTERAAEPFFGRESTLLRERQAMTS